MASNKDWNGNGNSIFKTLGASNHTEKETLATAGTQELSRIERIGTMIELQPEDIYLTRAWLLKHGWEPTKNIPLFQHDPDCIDADLCVIVDRKDYMIAKFHYMGDDAWKPDAKPDSFELVGVNNSCDMLEYDHTRLVMAAYVCHLTGFDEIDKALGGVYEMTMTRKEQE